MATRRRRGGCALAVRRREAERCRSMALVLTLAILVLMTALVIAFLSTVTLDRQATANYSRSLQADSIALGGLDQVVSQIQAEITSSTFSTPIGTMYSPISNTNAVPQRMPLVTTAPEPIVTYSGVPVYNGAANLASASLSTTPSVNNRFISTNRWYQPQLTLTTSGFPVPQWILVSRNGSYPTGWSTNLANHSLGNGNFIVGRFAYVVYDTSGLIDVNVAGCPSTVPAGTAANKGALSWIDLTQLTNAINQSDVDNLINWRNNANSSTYAQYATNWATNGFMQVAPGDTAFLSRQELIKWAQQATNSAGTAGDWTNALPYLTTFSRELNGPTWGPTFNSTTNGFTYLTSSTNDSSSTWNPLIYFPTNQATFTRNNGTTAVPGEPLVKYRFPLDKLALLEAATDGVTTSAANAALIAQYFGLDIAQAPGPYRHFIYPTTNPLYKHNVLSGTSGIMSLNDVAALPANGYPGREPDFFELLQAGVLQGSLGVHNYVTSSQSKSARGDFAYQLSKTGNAPTYLVGGGTEIDPDTTLTFQILRIGANIIDQWHADNYPTTLTYSFNYHGTTVTADVYGIADLPYISALFVLPYIQAQNYGGGTGPTIYMVPQLWNPHESSGATTGPTQFQIAPDFNHGSGNTGDAWTFAYLAPGANTGTWSGAYFQYNPATQAFGGAVASTNFYSTNVIAFSATAGSYRDPSVITTAVAANNASGPWAPTSPPVGAIQLSFPLPTGTVVPISQYKQTGTLSILTPVSITNAQPVNGTGTNTILDWAQATNSANYGSSGFNLPSASTVPIYQTEFAWNGVFGIEYQNPIDGNYYPYGTFEGLYNCTNWETGFHAGLQAPLETNASSAQAPLSYAQVWVKSDPRTFRLGPGQASGTGLASASGNANPYLSINPTNTPALATLTNSLNNEFPFYAIGGISYNAGYTLPSNYRHDLWADNDPNLTAAGAPSSPVLVNYTYPDPDGVIRYGDAHYAYNKTAGYAVPFLTGAINNRPVILHRPFRSVGELGYVFRDDPWRTLDFSSPTSADAGLLEFFTMSDGQVVNEHNGQQTVAVAGRVSPNTPYPPVLAAMLVGGTQNAGGGTILSTNAAFSLGTNIVTTSSTLPFINRADFVTRFITNSAVTNSSLYLKTEREAIVRSLAETSNTRTWNFLIDIVAQSGTYPQTATGVDNFVVGGERHYWLHIAIDRYTGQVVDRQLEEVSE